MRVRAATETRTVTTKSTASPTRSQRSTPRTVLPSGLPNLATRIMPLLEGRCTAQGAQVSSRSSPVIADGVARDKQGGAAERHDDAHNACHQE
jgi:hypothetical protein